MYCINLKREEKERLVMEQQELKLFSKNNQLEGDDNK